MRDSNFFLQVVAVYVSCLIGAAVAQPVLFVENVDPDDYSVLGLTCRQGGIRAISNAVFLKDNFMIDVEPATSASTYRYTFAPGSGEANFSCSNGSATSASLLVIAPPNITVEERARYVIFPTANDARRVTLFCDIQPTASLDRYTGGIWLINQGTGPAPPSPTDFAYNFAFTMRSTDSFLYRCRVRIAYLLDPVSVFGPQIRIVPKVLAQIIGPIQGMNVTVGDQANFSCNVSSNEVLINWTVGGKQYDMCRDQEDSQSICFINENTVFGMISRLNIPDTSILRGDTFTVSCKVSQMINENFLRDPSYESRFNETLTESAVLIIRPPVSPSTSTVSLSPSNYPTNPPLTPSTPKPLKLGAIVGGSASLIVVLVLVSIFLLICCLCMCRKHRSKDPEGKYTNCFKWDLRHDKEESDDNNSMKLDQIRSNPTIHAPINEQIHGGDCPELHRQNGIPNASHNGFDLLDTIYNFSQNSAKSGISALSEYDDSSNPPSPAVSSIRDAEESPLIEMPELSQDPRPSIFIGPGDQHLSQASTFGIQRMFDFPDYHQNGHDLWTESLHSGTTYNPNLPQNPLDSLGIPVAQARSGSQSSVHSERSYRSNKTHSTKASSRSGQSSKSGRSEYLDVESEYPPHQPRSRDRSPSSHRSQSRSKSPKGRGSPANVTFAAEPSMPSQYRSHNALPTDPYGPFESNPMRYSRSDEQIRHPRPSYFNPPVDHRCHVPDSTCVTKNNDIINEVLLTAVGCLMHQEDCQIPRCPCKQVKERFQYILPQTRTYRREEANKVIEESQRGEFNPNDRKQQMRLTLASQNISKDIHPHFHITSHSHIRQSRGKLPVRNHRRSKSVDLTPVLEQPESCTTTPGVFISEKAKDLLANSAFSPVMTPTGDKLRVLSPTTPCHSNNVPLPMLLREISLSADNLPSLCLNGCPMVQTPQGSTGFRTPGSVIKSPLSSTQQRWSPEITLPSVKERDSCSSDEGTTTSDRYTTQDSVSSIQTSTTHSSGRSGNSDENSVFSTSDYSSLNKSMLSSDPEESIKRRHNFNKKGRQDALLQDPSSDSGCNLTDEEMSLVRSRPPPDNLPLNSPLKTSVLQSKPLDTGKHLVPTGTGDKRVHRTASTSSHSSHTSHLSNVSHASHASHTSAASYTSKNFDGSFTTETVC